MKYHGNGSHLGAIHFRGTSQIPTTNDPAYLRVITLLPIPLTLLRIPLISSNMKNSPQRERTMTILQSFKCPIEIMDNMSSKIGNGVVCSISDITYWGTGWPCCNRVQGRDGYTLVYWFVWFMQDLKIHYLESMSSLAGSKCSTHLLIVSSYICI